MVLTFKKISLTSHPKQSTVLVTLEIFYFSVHVLLFKLAALPVSCINCDKGVYVTFQLTSEQVLAFLEPFCQIVVCSKQ